MKEETKATIIAVAIALSLINFLPSNVNRMWMFCYFRGLDVFWGDYGGLELRLGFVLEGLWGGGWQN